MKPLTITPDASAQHRTLPLIVTAAAHGYRLAFMGGERFETVQWGDTLQETTILFPTAEAAMAAYRAAKDAVSRWGRPNHTQGDAR